MSENIKMGREFKYRNGECCYNMGKVLGFNQDKEGIVTINEEQAVVVKLMYEGYLNGMSVGGITLKSPRITGGFYYTIKGAVNFTAPFVYVFIQLLFWQV